MKVLHLVHRYHPSVGGSQHLFKNLSERLVNLFDDEVTVYTSNALDSTTDRHGRLLPVGEEMIGGVRVRRFPYSRSWLPALKLAKRATWKARLPLRDYFELLHRGPIAPGMLRAVLDTDVDVIGATPFDSLHILYPDLAKRLGKKTPVVYWGALHIVDNYVPPVVLRAINRAEAYVANTSYERDVLVSKGIPPAKIHVLGAGVAVEQFARADGEAIRRSLNIGDEPVVAFIGRQAIGKGIGTLVKAMEAVWAEIPAARLLIAGSRSNFSERLGELVGALSPQQQAKVVIVDNFTEVEKAGFYAACDVFVCVSRVESFGIVYLEAWASGRPVIGSNTGAVQRVISNGHDGLLVSYGRADELAAAILELLLDKKLRVTLAANGQAKVCREYSWDTIAHKLHLVYDQLQ